MEQSIKRIVALVSALVAVLGVVATVWVTSSGLPVLLQEKRWLALGLTLGALACTRLARDRAGRHAVRLTSAFVLAAMMLLPAPGGLLVGLAALAAGRGNGVAGPAASARVGLPATVIALLATQYVAATAPVEANVHPLLAAGVLFLVLQGLTLLGVAVIAGPSSLLGETACDRPVIRRAEPPRPHLVGVADSINGCPMQRADIGKRQVQEADSQPELAERVSGQMALIGLAKIDPPTTPIHPPVAPALPSRHQD